MLKSVWSDVFRDFSEILLNAFLEKSEFSSMLPAQITRFFNSARLIVPSSTLGNHSEVVEIFFEVLIVCKREDNSNPVPFPIDNILLNRTHRTSVKY